MPFIKTDIEGLVVFEPKVIEDSRGFFMESYNANSFLNEGGIGAKFVQDNRSMSHKGVIRGLHYQIGASAQAKLVTVLKGEVIDFVVDCRKDSPTYKMSYQILLTEQNKKQLFVCLMGFFISINNSIVQSEWGFKHHLLFIRKS